MQEFERATGKFARTAVEEAVTRGEEVNPQPETRDQLGLRGHDYQRTVRQFVAPASGVALFTKTGRCVILGKG